MEYPGAQFLLLQERTEEEMQNEAVLDHLGWTSSPSQILQHFNLRSYKEIFDIRQVLAPLESSDQASNVKNTDILRFIESFIKFNEQTSAIHVSRTQLMEFVKLKVDAVPKTEKELLDLFTAVLYKNFFKAGAEKNIFKSDEARLLFSVVALKLCTFMKKQHTEVKHSLFYNQEFWEQMRRVFFELDISHLKSVWKKLLRKYSEKNNWKKEEIQLLSEIARRFKNKKVWKKISMLLFKESQGRFKRNGKQCSEKWKNMLNLSSEKHVWTKEEDLKLLKLILAHGLAWKKLAFCMNVRSKYSLIRRYKKILRKYQKSFVANLKEVTQETKTLLRLIIANLEGESDFFCPLFYKPHGKGAERGKTSKASNCSSSTAASSPSSFHGKQSVIKKKYKRVSFNTNGERHLKNQSSFKPETKTEESLNSGIKEQSLFDISSLKANQSLSLVFGVEDGIKTSSPYDFEYGQHHHNQNDFLLVESSAIKSNLANKFDVLHQEFKQAFRPNEVTPSKLNCFWPSFDFEHFPKQNNKINISEICSEFLCEADDMVFKWYEEDV